LETHATSGVPLDQAIEPILTKYQADHRRAQFAEMRQKNLKRLGAMKDAHNLSVLAL
jgi:hypothetical protein